MSRDGFDQGAAILNGGGGFFNLGHAFGGAPQCGKLRRVRTCALRVYTRDGTPWVFEGRGLIRDLTWHALRGLRACHPTSKGRGRLSFMACLPQSLDERGQGLAFDELHGVEVDAALAADEMDGHDVLMLEMGGRVGLVLEALKLLGVQGAGEGQDL